MTERETLSKYKYSRYTLTGNKKYGKVPLFNVKNKPIEVVDFLIYNFGMWQGACAAIIFFTHNKGIYTTISVSQYLIHQLSKLQYKLPVRVKIKKSGHIYTLEEIK